MFWHHPDWIELDTALRAPALALILRGLPAHERDMFGLWQAAGSGPDATAGGAQLLVGAMRVRRLDFFPDHWLYELTIALDGTAFANRYESARAFVVLAVPGVRRAAKAALPPHADPVMHDPAAAVTALRMTWTSGVLHQLNNSTGMRLATSGSFDAALAAEYLDFFVSFLAGGDGDHSPFLLPRGGTLLAPEGIARRTGLPSFEQAVREQILQGRPLVRPTRYDTPEDPARPDPHDDVEVQQADVAERSDGGPDAPPGADNAAAPEQDIPDIRVVRERPEGELDVPSGEQAAIELAAVALYQGAWFRARFGVSQREGGDTYVSMVEDHALAVADASLLQYRIDTLHVSGLRLLLCLKPRTCVRAEEFIEQLRRATAATRRSSATTLANLRVSGDVHLQQLDPRGAIHVRDVEFLGRVVLDECRRDASVQFEHCQFARTFEARHAVIEGDLVLRGSHIRAVTAVADSDDSPAAQLAGVRVSGDIDATELEIDGEFDATGAQVAGRIDLRGVDVLAKIRNGRAISLRNARVAAAVDLAPRVQRDAAMRPSIRRSRVHGLLDMSGLQGLEVMLAGASIGVLDLGYARLDGCLDMTCFDPDSVQSTPARLRGEMLRTTVAGYANLRFLRASEIWLAGANIGGELNLLSAQIAGSVFSRHLTTRGYRLRVGDEVTLSGARIRGDVDLCGARVEGPVIMRTGSLGRLFLSMSPRYTVDAQGTALGHFPAEAAQVELVGVTGLGGVNFAGIRCNTDGRNRHGVVLEHIECSGDITFYWGQGEERNFVAAAARAGEIAGPQSPPVRQDTSMASCRALVGGDVVMRRVVTGGFIDLTNLQVERGSVRLNDARIGTDIFARASALRGDDFERSARHDRSNCGLALHAEGLDLDNARIDGDALLAGMVLSRSEAGDGCLRARGLQVGGKLELHAGSGCGARIEGGVLLAGASAADLWLPGANALATGAVEAAQGEVVLEGAKLGGLHIDEPIPRLNMTGIAVESWKLGQRDGSSDVAAIVAILSRMQPMDRSVWTSVEGRLRNEARGADADRIYRTMRRLEPVSVWGAGPKWLSRWLFGFGTRVWPALLLWVLLSVSLFALLARPENVKLTGSSLLQLGSQCTRLDAGSRMLPGKCLIYAERIGATPEATVELTAAQLEQRGESSGYGWGDAAILGLRYGVPLIGGFGDSEWEPVEQQPAGGPLSFLGLTPAIAAAAALLLNTLLLSFTAAFVARRWLR